MYQALYRKWRPRSFDQVVGQAHITDTLKQQVASGRLSHAYLFTGTRGTGKTSCAKILARAVNCEAPVLGNPCNGCPSCRGIEDGSILDVLELDAASNNGVDHVRALRDEAIYTPAAVRKRVYIIDEVHMLSTPAFNALLKILEEPPAHLLFILATTELHKVPATIKSRCQQFSFRRIRPEEIASQLQFIAGQEQVELKNGAAQLLARLAQGGLRDALSLLDQCVGSAKRLDEEQVLQVLGLAGNGQTETLLSQIASGDTAGALETVGALYQDGKDMAALLGELTVLLRDLLLWKTTKTAGALLSGGYEKAVLERLGASFSGGELVQMLGILQKASAELIYSSNRRSDVELCVLRLCRRELSEDLQGLLVRVSRLEAQLATGATPPIDPAKPQTSKTTAESQTPPQVEDAPPWETAPPVGEPQTPPQVKDAPPQREEVPPQVEEAPPWEAAPPVSELSPVAPQAARTEPKAQNHDAAMQEGSWPGLVATLKQTLPRSAYSLLSNTQLVKGALEGETLSVYFSSDMEKMRLDKAELKATVEAQASAYYGKAVKLKLLVGEMPKAEAPKAETPSGHEAAAVHNPQENRPEAAPRNSEDKLGQLLELGKTNKDIISIV